MICCIDVGNTNVVIGVYRDDKLVTSFRLRSDKNRTVEEYYVLMDLILSKSKISLSDFEGVIVASVVPPIYNILKQLFENIVNIKPILLNGKLAGKAPLNTKFLYKGTNIAELGADRLANCLGAVAENLLPAIIIDIGTATTMEVINSDGEFIGGNIICGIEMSLRALHENTATLPHITMLRPEHVISTNTITNMQAGLYYGQLAMFKGLSEQIKKEYFANEMDKVNVILTGGYSRFFYQDWQDAKHLLNLTLDGIYFAYTLLKEHNEE